MDCEICYENNSKLTYLSCGHKLCYYCYLRLIKTICPFCRKEFNYTNKDIKQKISLDLQNDQSNYVVNELDNNYHMHNYRTNSEDINYTYYDNIVSKKKIFTKYYDLDIIREKRYNINKREIKKWVAKEIKIQKYNESIH